MAFTFAVYVVEGKWRKNAKIALAVVFIDLVGAFTAIAISLLILGPNNTFTLVPPKNVQNHTFAYLAYLLIIEAYFTMVLILVVLFVKSRKLSATNDGMLSNLTCAIAMYVCVRLAGPFTGAGLNLPLPLQLSHPTRSPTAQTPLQAAMLTSSS